MEVKSFRSDLDELFNNLFFWKISQNNMLLVLRKNDKSVRNTRSISVLLILKSFFYYFPAIRINPLGRSNHFSN